MSSAEERALKRRRSVFYIAGALLILLCLWLPLDYFLRGRATEREGRERAEIARQEAVARQQRFNDLKEKKLPKIAAEKARMLSELRRSLVESRWRHLQLEALAQLWQKFPQAVAYIENLSQVAPNGLFRAVYWRDDPSSPVNEVSLLPVRAANIANLYDRASNTVVLLYGENLKQLREAHVVAPDQEHAEFYQSLAGDKWKPLQESTRLETALQSALKLDSFVMAQQMVARLEKIHGAANFGQIEPESHAAMRLCPVAKSRDCARLWMKHFLMPSFPSEEAVMSVLITAADFEELTELVVGTVWARDSKVSAGFKSGVPRSLLIGSDLSFEFPVPAPYVAIAQKGTRVGRPEYLFYENTGAPNWRPRFRVSVIEAEEAVVMKEPKCPVPTRKKLRSDRSLLNEFYLMVESLPTCRPWNSDESTRIDGMLARAVSAGVGEGNPGQ